MPRASGSSDRIAIRRQQPYLVRDLTAEAAALRKLGRPDEAAKPELRTQSIPSTQADPN